MRNAVVIDTGSATGHIASLELHIIGHAARARYIAPVIRVLTHRSTIACTATTRLWLLEFECAALSLMETAAGIRHRFIRSERIH